MKAGASSVRPRLAASEIGIWWFLDRFFIGSSIKLSQSRENERKRVVAAVTEAGMAGEGEIQLNFQTPRTAQ